MSAGREKALVAVVLLAITGPAFYGLEALGVEHLQARWLATRLDTRIPLVPGAVWVYLSWYVAPWFALTAPRHDFRRLAAATGVAFLFCMACYALFPISMDRPEIEGHSISEQALHFLYENDPPWNIFPSFHATLCAILWRTGWTGVATRPIAIIWMVAICAACVLTKQHNVIDVVAGIAVGSGAVSLANIALPRPCIAA